GDGGHAAEVGAAADVALRHLRAHIHRFGYRFARVLVGNAVLANDDLGIDARGVDVAEDVGDVADRAPRRRRPARQLDDHHLAGRGAAFLPGRHEDVHQHAAIERGDVTHAVLVAVVASDDRRVAALEDPDDASFGAPALLDPFDPDHDAIAVHRFVQQRTRDVDVAAVLERTFGRDEAVSGRMGLQAADVQVHLLRQAEALAADLDQIAGVDERLDQSPESRALLTRHLENLQQLARAGGVVHPLAH